MSHWLHAPAALSRGVTDGDWVEGRVAHIPSRRVGKEKPRVVRWTDDSVDSKVDALVAYGLGIRPSPVRSLQHETCYACLLLTECEVFS